MLLTKQQWEELIERSRFVAIDPNKESVPKDSSKEFHPIVNHGANQTQLNETQGRSQMLGTNTLADPRPESSASAA